MTRTGALILAVALALLAGCGSSIPGTPAPTSTTSVTTSTAPPRLSWPVACHEIVQDLPAAADLVTEFVTDAQKLADGGPATTDRFDAAIKDLDYDAQIAPLPLVPFIGQQRDTLDGIRDYLIVGGARSTDLRDFRTSGPEIIMQCGANS